MSRKKTAKNMKSGMFIGRVLIILLIGSLLLTLCSAFTFPAEGKRTGDDYEKPRLVDGAPIIELSIKINPSLLSIRLDLAIEEVGPV